MKSEIARSMLREVEIEQWLDVDGVLYFWELIKNEFVSRVTGETLEERITALEKSGVGGGSTGGGIVNSVAWENVTGKPTDLVHTSDMTTAIATATAGFASLDAMNIELDSIDERIDATETAIAARPTEDQVDAKINAKVAGVYRFMGSVPAYSNLPTSGMRNGDVYDVEDQGGMNYGWVVDSSQPGGGYWDPLGQVFHMEPIPNSVIKAIVEGTYGQ